MKNGFGGRRGSVVFVGDCAGIRQRVPVNDPFPELAAKHQKRHSLHTPGLDQRQRLKQLVHGAKSARKNCNGGGAHQKVHFPDPEVMKIKRQIGRHIFIRRLLVRQDDVEPDRDTARIVGAAISSLHHARSAAGDNDVFAFAVRERPLGDHARESPGFVIK